MYKLARHFLLGSQMCINGDYCFVPSKVYLEGVAKEICNGERGEFRTCLE